MAHDWIDVCIPKRFDAGELLSRLDDPSIRGAWEDDGVVHLYWPEDHWNEDRLASVRLVLQTRIDRDIQLSTAGTGSGLEQAWARSVSSSSSIDHSSGWEPVALGPQDRNRA